jgi:hypothetical protein
VLRKRHATLNETTQLSTADPEPEAALHQSDDILSETIAEINADSIGTDASFTQMDLKTQSSTPTIPAVPPYSATEATAALAVENKEPEAELGTSLTDYFK